MWPSSRVIGIHSLQWEASKELPATSLLPAATLPKTFAVRWPAMGGENADLVVASPAMGGENADLVVACSRCPATWGNE